MGGMIAQVFASQNDVAGIVFDDSSVAAQVGAKDPEWEDGPGNPVDMVVSRHELQTSGDFGDTPVVVLTQNFTDTTEFDRSQQLWWRRQHSALAARSSSSIHVLAVDSGHMIQEDQPELVVAAVEEVLAAARSGQPLAPCDRRFETVGGRCLNA
jgi:pimeloyl-ACP methyl ester carboxylesterase